MKYILIIFVMMIGIQAEIINSKQIFNKKVVKVKKQAIVETKSFYGSTTYDETRINDVVLRYDGFIRNLNANSTHKLIKKDEVLFSIYSKEVVETLDELSIAVKHNYKNGFIKNIEDRLYLLDVDKEIVNRIKKTKVTPYYINVKSKHDGIIINKAINENSFIKRGARVFQLADISKIWVNAKVYQKDISFLKKEMNANIYIEGVGNFKSKVALIHPIMDNDTKTISVRLILDNKDLKVFPNMFAKIKFAKDKNVMLVLPKTAVITKADKHFVFKPLEDGEYEPIEVVAKRINSYEFQIISGLKEGDVVINSALFMLDSDAVTNGLYSEDDDW